MAARKPSGSHKLPSRCVSQIWALCGSPCVAPPGLSTLAHTFTGASRHRLGLCQPSGLICVEQRAPNPSPQRCRTPLSVLRIAYAGNVAGRGARSGP